MKSYLNWSVGYSDSALSIPKEFFLANVPGSVQLDYIREKNLPDFRYKDNIKNYLWMQDKYWVYSASYTPVKKENENSFLIVNGVDYKYEIFINDDSVCAYEGMYKKQVVDLNAYSQKIEIKIIIYPAPKSDLDFVYAETRDEANQCCKPAVSYGWDFHPRFIPLGIWDEVYIYTTKKTNYIEPTVRYELSDDRKNAKVFFENGTDNSDWKFFDPNGKEIANFKGQSKELFLCDIVLWWCNGYGNANLYHWLMTNDEGESYEGNIGFRTVELVKPSCTWCELGKYPMTRNTPPICIKLNGVEIFSKGTNYVAPEIFYSEIDYDRYYEQLAFIKNANINYIRCWGGAIVPKSYFYDICDKLGLFVWQEFPLSCNNYLSTKSYLDVLHSEATAIVNRVKFHPCLMLWCGGNELFNSWSKMTDQSLALRILNMVTLKETPEIPFLPTAPVMGMAHGAYDFIYEPERIEVFEALSNSRCTGYTEIGIPSYSNIDTLRLIAPCEELKIREDEIADFHNAEHQKRWILERYFPSTDDIEELIGESQYLQAIGLQFVFEEARRQKPYCSMVGNWCFNEPWPCVDNNSIMSYPNSLKPAYYNVAAACRSVLVSAKIHRLVYVAGQTLEFDLTLLNDSLCKIDDGRVNVIIQIGDTSENVLSWDYKNVKINTNLFGPTVRYSLPFVENAETVKIILESGAYSSEYTLLYKLPNAKQNAPIKLNSLDKQKGDAP